MARARMIARNITKSKKIAAASERARCIYMMLMPFTDREGRTVATPSYLKGAIFRHLEYTEAQLQEAIWELHDLTLVSLYQDEDDLVLQFHDFLEFNRPANKESASELPAPTPELLARDMHVPSGTHEKLAPSIARALPEQGTSKVRAEVEVEVETETEVEGEGEGKKITPPQENAATASQTTRPPPPKDRSREQAFRLIKEKLQTRKNKQDPDGVLLECLNEDPERDAWFDLPPPKVRELIAKATARYRKGEVRFKTELILLLDRATLETRRERQQQKPELSPSDRLALEYEQATGRKLELD